MFVKNYSKAIELSIGDNHRKIKLPPGCEVFYLDRELTTIHNDKGPAVRDKNRTIELWMQNGHLHRIGGSALKLADGTEEYYENGDLHRLEGPAMKNANGDLQYYVHGIIHRITGPAIEYTNGGKYYYQKGLLHREDGPAIEEPDCESGPDMIATSIFHNKEAYYLYGKRYSKEDWQARVSGITMSPGKFLMGKLTGFLNKIS